MVLWELRGGCDCLRGSSLSHGNDDERVVMNLAMQMPQKLLQLQTLCQADRVQVDGCRPTLDKFPGWVSTGRDSTYLVDVKGHNCANTSSACARSCAG